MFQLFARFFCRLAGGFGAGRLSDALDTLSANGSYCASVFCGKLGEAMLDALRESAEDVNSVADYKEWSRKHLRPILPHEAMISGWGHRHAGGVGLDVMVIVDFPPEHLEKIRNRIGAIDTPILWRWLVTEKPVLFDADNPWPDVPPQWLESFRGFGLRNVLAHAQWDDERVGGTYHSLYRMPSAPGEHESRVFEEVVPILHEAFCRVMQSLSVADRFSAALESLTARERDVVRWLGIGKTNSEIASINGISENTVKHYVTEIFNKLGVSNRTQLVRRLAEHEARDPVYQTKVY